MILKDKVISPTNSPTLKAGQKQEQDVAFFLRRHFKDDKSVLVFNDLKLTHNDETAQIDHLILYPYGFVLIESKSITGEVSVNRQEEWSRSYNNQWRGMPSPLKQVELQQKLIRELLFERRAEILDTFLLKQQSFGGRCWDNICAVSSNAIINREQMPENISAKLVKSEFLGDKLKAIMKIRNPLLNIVNILDTRPAFNAQEMKSIADFLLANDQSMLKTKVNKPVKNDEVVAELSSSYQTEMKANKDVSPPIEKPANAKVISISCSKCNEANQLAAKAGKFGYYFKCGACTANTSMKVSCPSCQNKKTKVSKKKETYKLICEACDTATEIAT